MVEIIINVLSVLGAIYMFIIIIMAWGWMRKKELVVPQNFHPKTPLTILIPARNEELRIEKCLTAIQNQFYPKHLIQVLVMDDHSEDETAKIANEFSFVTVVDMSEFPQPKSGFVAYKKFALEKGVSFAKGSLIITTDADCFAGPNWLRAIAYCYETKRQKMLIAPVTYADHNNTVELFQTIDFISMQGITGGLHEIGMGAMANGANLIFEKKAFYEVSGYDGTHHLASGDDLFLLSKFNQKFPKEVGYLKCEDAIVTTYAQPNIKEFLRQRIRWASKNSNYSDWRFTLCIASIYCFNVALLISIFIALFIPQLWPSIAAIFLGKVFVDNILFFITSHFFKLALKSPFVIIFQPFHIIYVTISGFLGLIGHYTWKGRTLK